MRGPGAAVRGGDVWHVGYQGPMVSEARRDDRALRAVWRELRRPRILVSYLRKSGDLTVPP
jgi:hypothetical protein